MRRIYERIETIQCAWEDYWFVKDLLSKTLSSLGLKAPFDREGAVLHHANFRPYLNTLGRAPLVASELARFAPPAHMTLPLSLISLHASLAAWCQFGRHVYDLSAAVQNKLSSIALGDRSWVDIPVPQVSFAVTLERPIMIPRSQDALDLILVGPHTASAVCAEAPRDFRISELRAFRSTAGTYQPLKTKARKLLQRYMAQKRYHKLADELNDLLEHVSKISSLVLILPEANTQPIADTLKPSNRPTTIALALVQELVARLCLYLAESPSAAVLQSPPPLTGTSDSIVRGVQVYSVM